MTDMEAKALLKKYHIKSCEVMSGPMGESPARVYEALMEAHREGMEEGREVTLKSTLPELGKSLDAVILLAKHKGMEEAAKVAEENHRVYEVYEPRGQLIQYCPGKMIAAAIREKIKDA